MHARTGLLLGLLLAAGVTGCGVAHGNNGVATAGGANPSASPSATPDQASEQQQLLKFTQCMRDNGIDMPDPEMNGDGGISLMLPDGTDPTKADAATKKCRQYMPNGGEPQKMDPAVVDQLRRLAQCMRDNGVANFPDPTDEGLQINGNTSGLDPNDPTFAAAMKACDKYQPVRPSGAPDSGSRVSGGGGGVQ